MRRLLIATCTLAFLAVGAATLIAGDETWPYAVLSEPRKANDTLPAEVVDSPTARYDLGDPASARRVGEFHGGTYFLMEGATHETVCLVRHEPKVNVMALCTPAFAKFDKPSVMSALDEDHRRVSAVIVRDGYTSAVVKTRDSEVRVPIARNVAFYSTQRAGRLELRGPRQPTLSVPIRRLQVSLPTR